MLMSSINCAVNRGKVSLWHTKALHTSLTKVTEVNHEVLIVLCGVHAVTQNEQNHKLHRVEVMKPFRIAKEDELREDDTQHS